MKKNVGTPKRGFPVIRNEFNIKLNIFNTLREEQSLILYTTHSLSKVIPLKINFILMVKSKPFLLSCFIDILMTLSAAGS